MRGLGVKKILPLILLLLAITLHAAVFPRLAPEQAAKHVGETVVVSGTIAQVKATSHGSLFLNFGGKYPHQVFAVYIPCAAAPKLAEVRFRAGDHAVVTGPVKLWKGQPQIVLTDPARILVRPASSSGLAQ